jgi:hypothetical protein
MLRTVSEADENQQRRLTKPAELLEIRSVIAPCHITS